MPRAMDMAAYKAIDAVNFSTAKHRRVSAKEYKAALDGRLKDPDGDRLVIGTAAHLLALEPERAGEIAVFDGRLKAGKAWEAFEAANLGRVILKPQQLADVTAMVKAVNAHPIASPFLRATGPVECVVTATDPATGLLCKGRLDKLVTDESDFPRAVADLKFTDLDERRFAAWAVDAWYFQQQAFYRELVRLEMLAVALGNLEGEPLRCDDCGAMGDGAGFFQPGARGATLYPTPDGWRCFACDGRPLPCKLITCEASEPFDVVVYDLAEEDLIAGGRDMERMLSLIARDRFADVWPGRAEEGEVTLCRPAWARRDAV